YRMRIGSAPPAPPRRTAPRPGAPPPPPVPAPGEPGVPAEGRDPGAQAEPATCRPATPAATYKPPARPPAAPSLPRHRRGRVRPHLQAGPLRDPSPGFPPSEAVASLEPVLGIGRRRQFQPVQPDPGQRP